MSLVQIQKHQGWIKRVPFGETPIIELDLEPNREVINAKLRESVAYSDRKTTDYRYEVWTVWRA